MGTQYKNNDAILGGIHTSAGSHKNSQSMIPDDDLIASSGFDDLEKGIANMIDLQKKQEMEEELHL